MSINSNTEVLSITGRVNEARNAGLVDGYGGYGRDHGYLDSLVRANQIGATEAYEGAYARGLGRRQAEQDRAAAEMYGLAVAGKPSRRAAGRSGSRKGA